MSYSPDWPDTFHGSTTALSIGGLYQLLPEYCYILVQMQGCSICAFLLTYLLIRLISLASGIQHIYDSDSSQAQSLPIRRSTCFFHGESHYTHISFVEPINRGPEAIRWWAAIYPSILIFRNLFIILLFIARIFFVQKRHLGRGGWGSLPPRKKKKKKEKKKKEKKR